MSIKIPNSLKVIGENAFKGCSGLTSVNLGNSVKAILPRTFCDCTRLSSITIPYSVTSIGHSAFEGCSSLMSIRCEATTPPACEQDAFYAVNKSISLIIPSISAGQYSYARGWNRISNIQTYVISYGPCGENLNWSYKDATLIISGKGSMYDYSKRDSSPWYDVRNSIETIIINNGVTSIGTYAFYGLQNKQLRTIKLPNSVVVIRSSAFEDCSYLKSVTIGSKVEEIQSDAFANDERLLYITSYAVEPPVLSDDAFPNYDAYLQIPCEAKNEYMRMNGWKWFDSYNISCIETI